MLCASAPARTQEVVVEDPIDAMLRELSMTRRGAVPGIGAPYRWRSGMQNPPLTMRMLTRPLEAPYVAGILTSQHRNWSHSIVMTVLQAAGRTPAQVRRGYQGNPLASWDARLTSAEDPFVAGALGAVSAARGETDEALLWLERAYSAGFRDPILLRMNPMFDSVRQDAGFVALIGQLEDDLANMRRLAFGREGTMFHDSVSAR